MFITVIGPRAGLQRIALTGDPTTLCRQMQERRDVPIVIHHSAVVEGHMASTALTYVHSLLSGHRREHAEWFDVTPADAVVAVKRGMAALVPDHRAKGKRKATQLVGAQMSFEVGQQVRDLAEREGRTMKDLVLEGINRVFKNRGLPLVDEE